MVDKFNGIWDLETAKKKHRFDDKLAKYILKNYNPNKFADIGCGPGFYCNYFKQNGWENVTGYEGTINIQSLGIYKDIITIDLTQEINNNPTYDLVICLEVGEHIPKNFENIFIDNVCKFCNKDLILSWAIPGQGGTGHYNEQINDYVIQEIIKRDFVYKEELSIQIRKSSSLKWFRNTLMIFEKRKG